MSHEISLAVWDARSPVVIGRRATLKVGVSCPSGCSLTGTRIDIRDRMGASVASGHIGPEPWPDTRALCWVELEMAVPDTEGDHEFSISAEPAGADHPRATSVIRFVAARPPEHRVTLEVVEKGSGAALAGVELRVGVFRTATDDAGVAYVDVPGGVYEVCAWKIGYDVLSTTMRVACGATVRLEVAATPQTEQPYWM